MKDIHQWLSPIASLLMITISGTLATVSVKGNNGTVLIAKTNNRGNVKINQDIGDFTDVNIQLTKPYPFPAKYHQLHHVHTTVKPRKQLSRTKKPTAASKNVKRTNPTKSRNYHGAKSKKHVLAKQPSRTKKPAAASKNVKRINPTKKPILANPSRPKEEKLNPISVKDNRGTIIVARKNTKGNIKINHDIGHFDAFN